MLENAFRHRALERRIARDPAEGMQPSADREAERESDGVTTRSHGQVLAARSHQVELAPGPEGREGKPEAGQDLDGEVDHRPTAPGRAPGDAGHDDRTRRGEAGGRGGDRRPRELESMRLRPATW